MSPTHEPDPDAVEAFWARARQAIGVAPTTPTPAAWHFGDSADMADELIDLVLSGTKQATASAVAEYEASGDPLPSSGELSIVTDGALRPRALIETTEVGVAPLSSVDDRFAWDEGEGDRSRATWLDGHTRYFTRAFARLGLEFHEDIAVVFERFAVRYQED